ncbi:MAG: hypothetical protein IH624_17390 [Phycisphaerae bacterium]|nr:hypothetical protein [Phycisphaerae bacterium]
MANSPIAIPFYVTHNGAPLTGAAGEMAFVHLRTLGGADKSPEAPAITEIGGGWYAFAVAWGTAPFDAGDLFGVIDADRSGVNALDSDERYKPVEARLGLYAPARLVNRMTQSTLNGDMVIHDADGDAILTLRMADDGDGVLERIPGAAD